MNSPILLAYALDGNGGGSSLAEGDVSQHMMNDTECTWVHLDANHENIGQWLTEELPHIDQMIIDALLAEETRPRMMQFEQGALLILRGVNLNQNSEPEDMISIRLWIDQYKIISMRRRKLRAIGDIEEKLKQGRGPEDSGAFVYTLTARLFERMEPVLSNLDETTDDIEELILESTDVKIRQSIIDVRKQAIIFRRYMAPQREAINQLRLAEFQWLKENHRRYLQESYNHVTRYLEDLDAVRERAQIIKDEFANIIADRLNRNMYMLSIVAAIFLPLGFLTGLLGINVGGIPGAEYPYAFIVFCALLALVVVFQTIIFKRLKWF